MSKTLLRPLSLASFLCFSTSAFAGTLFVDANLTTGLNDGSSWADAYQGIDALQTALGAAVSGDEIYVAQGTYRPSSSGLRQTSFSLLNDVEIYGGFLGTEASPAERPPFGSAPSIMSADLAGNDGSGVINDNSYHLIRGNGVNASAVVDGFTITGGNANAGGNNNKGGGILTVSGASPTIRNCHIIGNRCTFGGGAGYISGGAAPSYTDVIFEDNIGGAFGGAFDMAGAGAVRFDRCTFIGNTAQRAGAIEIFATTGVIVSNCLIQGNTATGNDGGGGIWVGSGGNPQFRNCTVVDNNATSHSSGGFRNQGSNPSIRNCVFWGNEGPGGAGGTVNQITGTSTVSYSIVEGGIAGTGNLSSDPQFANAGSGDYRLGASSPAIDAGNNGVVPAGVTLDLDGNPRFVDDPSVADTGNGTAPLVDIGAYESGVTVFTAFCFGDGTGTACPCTNSGAAGNGCANGSFATGCNLGATGNPSIAGDTLSLVATQSTPGSPGIFFQGDDQLAGGAGLTFGDGLRCAGNGICRIELAFADGTGTASSVSAIAAGCGVSAGQTKRYQWWYRDNALSLCGSGFNVSNGIELTWLP